MKKRYEAPSVEIVKFEYSDQVVAQSAGCDIRYINKLVDGVCSKPEPFREYN